MLPLITNILKDKIVSGFGKVKQGMSNYFEPKPLGERNVTGLGVGIRDVIREGQNITSKPFQPSQEEISYAQANRGLTKSGSLLVKNPISKSGYTYVSPMITGSLINTANTKMNQIINPDMAKSIIKDTVKQMQYYDPTGTFVNALNKIDVSKIGSWRELINKMSEPVKNNPRALQEVTGHIMTRFKLF